MTLNNPLQYWSGDEVAAYLIEAADTLRRLPRVRLESKQSSWPDVVRTASELWVGEPHAKNRTAPPSPRAIDRMDVVLTWLLPLSFEQRRILWARSCGIPWRKLEDIDGRSHVTLRKVYNEGLDTLLRLLNSYPEAPKKKLIAG